jgi:hypothetical protein
LDLFGKVEDLEMKSDHVEDVAEARDLHATTAVLLLKI